MDGVKVLDQERSKPEIWRIEMAQEWQESLAGLLERLYLGQTNQYLIRFPSPALEKINRIFDRVISKYGITSVEFFFAPVPLTVGALSPESIEVSIADLKNWQSYSPQVV